jgi:hypothetical protein
MSETLLLLERGISSDLASIQELETALADAEPRAEDSQDRLIVTAYRLHNLYNAYENVFRQVAAAFENEIDRDAGWHSQLLQRMRLDLLPVRPAVIDAAAYEALDELRRFRHLFRSAYGIGLDAERLALVHRRAMKLREIFPPQIEAFLGFVRELRDGPS